MDKKEFGWREYAEMIYGKDIISTPVDVDHRRVKIDMDNHKEIWKKAKK